MARQRKIPSLFKHWCVWLLLLSLLGTGGCGKPGQISGKVKYNGKLLPSGRVVFFNSKDPPKQVGSASINSDGTYNATVPSGTLKIAIVTPPKESLKSMKPAKAKVVSEAIKKMKKGSFNPLDSENADAIPEKTIEVPPKFQDPSSSGLTIEVLGGPQTWDIDL